MALDPQSTEERTYWDRLKDHPGVPVLLFWCFAGFFIAGRDDWRRGALAVIMFLVMFGPIVLWTARR